MSEQEPSPEGVAENPELSYLDYLKIQRIFEQLVLFTTGINNSVYFLSEMTRDLDFNLIARDAEQDALISSQLSGVTANLKKIEEHCNTLKGKLKTGK